MKGYEFTEEYRDRFQFTQGDLLQMSAAFDYMAQETDKRLAEIEEAGQRPIIRQGYTKLVLDDILKKAEMWSSADITWRDI